MPHFPFNQVRRRNAQRPSVGDQTIRAISSSAIAIDISLEFGRRAEGGYWASPCYRKGKCVEPRLQ